MPSLPPFGDPDHEKALAAPRFCDSATTNQPGKTNQAFEGEPEPPDYQSTVSAIAEAVMRSITADGISLAYDFSGQPVVCRVSCGKNAPPPGTPLNLNSGIGGQCYREGKAITCADTESDQRVSKNICRQLGVRSMLAVPLRRDSAIIGVAQAFYAHPQGFSDANVAKLAASADLFVSCLLPAPVAEERTSAHVANTNKTVSSGTDTRLRTLQNPEHWNLQHRIAPIARVDIEKAVWWSRSWALTVAIAAIVALLWITWPQPGGELASSPRSEPGKHLEDAIQQTGASSESRMLAALVKQALAGDAEAQLLLAQHYERGDGIPQSLPLAYSWYIIAAEAGKTAATQAVRSLTPKLSAAEIAAIRRNVGNMYATGVGVRRRDYVAAYTWLLLAEAAGEPRAKRELEYLAAAMPPHDIAEAKRRVSQWLKAHSYPSPAQRRIKSSAAALPE